MNSLTIRRPDDMHLHLRDGAALESVVGHTAAQFARAVVMPNLKPPVTTVDMALAYRQRILATLPVGSDFMPLMTLYLTNHTAVDEIIKAKQSGHIVAVKYYPAGATTHSDSGVTDMQKVYSVLEALAEVGMPLLLHGEVTDPEVDIFDREAVFIEHVLAPLHSRIPELKIVLEHITTQHAVDFVESTSNTIAATITPQHCLMNRNALFQGGMRPHHYCLPVLKAEQHRKAVFLAATSGNQKFFLGTDSAPHAQGDKESACGCAGIYSAYSALEFYATIFETANAIEKLEGFASVYGAQFYGLPLNDEKIELRKHVWQLPQQLPFIEGHRLVPYFAGQELHWKLTGL